MLFFGCALILSPFATPETAIALLKKTIAVVRTTDLIIFAIGLAFSFFL